MNVKDNTTPEEKLLRLIRGKGKLEVKPVVASEGAPAPIKPGPGNKIYLLPEKLIRLINVEKALKALLALVVIYLVISFLYPLIGLKKIRFTVVQSQKSDLAKANFKQQVEPFDHYEQSIAGRQIFGQTGAEGAVSATINSNLIKDMNLVGILAGENPQAIIEDKKTQRTSYVVKGQYIGEFQVEDIQEGKIILNYRGQRYELYL